MSVQYQEQLLKIANYLEGKVNDSEGGEVKLTVEETMALIDLSRLVANEVFSVSQPTVDTDQIQAAVLERLSNYQSILQQVEILMKPFADLHTAIKLATRTNG